jgi:hypothetical protein
LAAQAANNATVSAICIPPPDVFEDRSHDGENIGRF